MSSKHVLSVLLLIVACTPHDEQNSSSSVLVDLGSGNLQAIEAYKGLDTSPCKGAQALISGFGKFNGGERNVTEEGLKYLLSNARSTNNAPAITSSEGDKTSLPSDDAAASVSSDENADLEIPTLALQGSADPQVSKLQMSRIYLDGIDTCVVIAPVNYHSPALLAKTARESGATHVYNLGQRGGTGYIEPGAINKTRPGSTVYDGEGNTVNQVNISTKVVESDQQSQIIQSSYDAKTIASATNIPKPVNVRAENDYICNATAYLLGRIAQGQTVEYLPGLQIPAAASIKYQGFIHVSDSSLPEDVAATVRHAMKASLSTLAPQ